MTPEPAADARPLRASKVVWGVILMATAALFFAVPGLDLGEVGGWVVLVWASLGVGAVLVIGGVIAALPRHRA